MIGNGAGVALNYTYGFFPVLGTELVRQRRFAAFRCRSDPRHAVDPQAENDSLAFVWIDCRELSLDRNHYLRSRLQRSGQLQR